MVLDWRTQMAKEREIPGRGTKSINKLFNQIVSSGPNTVGANQATNADEVQVLMSYSSLPARLGVDLMKQKCCE